MIPLDRIFLDRWLFATSPWKIEDNEQKQEHFLW